MPVWIRFPSLHLKFWTHSILNKIARLIGEPLFRDKATTQFERFAYARCFVEISAKQPLQKHVYLEIEGGIKLRLMLNTSGFLPLVTSAIALDMLIPNAPQKKFRNKRR